MAENRDKPIGLGDLDLDKLARRSPLDEIPSVERTTDPKVFGEIARNFFGPDNSLRPKNLTLEMLEQALDAYFAAKGTEIALALKPLQEQLPAALNIAERADTASKAAEKIVNELYTRLNDFEKRVGDPAAALEGFKASIAESLKLQEARRLWTSSANRAGRAYFWSSIALLLLLVAVPAIAIWQSNAIFGFFRAIGNAVLVDLPENASETAILIAAVSRLVLVTLPVALYIWLIRIVVRFNMRSLLLMDDANQRNTMLETYLHLVEQDAELKQDRPLILEALFRRTPGHGPETIEPPNLTDILRIGTPGGGVKP